MQQKNQKPFPVCIGHMTLALWVVVVRQESPRRTQVSSSERYPLQQFHNQQRSLTHICSRHMILQSIIKPLTNPSWYSSLNCVILVNLTESWPNTLWMAVVFGHVVAFWQTRKYGRLPLSSGSDILDRYPRVSCCHLVTNGPVNRMMWRDGRWSSKCLFLALSLSLSRTWSTVLSRPTSNPYSYYGRYALCLPLRSPEQWPT